MSPYHKKQKEKRRKNLFRKWHRRVGFCAALFLINLAITGILLNHSESLELHKQFVESDWLVDWYGIKAPSQATCFKTQAPEKPVCQIADKRVLGNQLLELESSDLIGIAVLEDIFYVASPDQISLYTQQWELIEIIGKDQGLPSLISAIGILKPATQSDTSLSEELLTARNSSDQLVIVSEQQHYLLNSNELTWTSTQTDISSLNLSKPTSKFSLDELQAIYLDHQINYLKLVQDLHSGRIVNSIGVWVTDIVAVIVILLTISGFLAWQKRTRN